MHRPQIYPATIVLTSLALSVFSPVVSDASESWHAKEQNFLITAYYSPLPDQDHYYLGSYAADIEFNGRGIEGNDGTLVYPGMIAAPPEYPFGTRIEIPRIGIVGTVHDRGGRIQAAADGTPHIDLWMGHGEEGLVRALEWGAQTVKGIAYAPGSENVPEESFDLAQFPAPIEMLAYLPENPISLQNIPDLLYGETRWEVTAMQHVLQNLGYFDHAITNIFGEVTRDALALFQRDLGIHGNGEIANEETRSALIAHREIFGKLSSPTLGEEILLKGTSGKSVRVLQRMLALLNLYTGEIDGIYDQELKDIMYTFQQEKRIVYSKGDIGAGMVGPITNRALLTAWRNYRIQKQEGSMMVASL